MKFFVYYMHCYEIVGVEEFDSAEKAGEFIIGVRECCDDACIKVIHGTELEIKDVEVVTKVTLVDPERPTLEFK